MTHNLTRRALAEFTGSVELQRLQKNSVLLKGTASAVP
jgi:hypothetical protein